jgi:hypothetical protein
MSACTVHSGSVILAFHILAYRHSLTKDKENGKKMASGNFWQKPKMYVVHGYEAAPFQHFFTWLSLQ